MGEHVRHAVKLTNFLKSRAIQTLQLDKLAEDIEQLQDGQSAMRDDIQQVVDLAENTEYKLEYELDVNELVRAADAIREVTEQVEEFEARIDDLESQLDTALTALESVRG